jgi:gliding motility-associated-like protein
MVDYVTVKVSPKVIAFAGNDTSVVIGQPVQFTATGGISYTWQPATGLNDPNIFNPIGTYQAGTTSVTYQVRVLDSNGCAGYDDVTVKIFQTAPEIFVPTAFSPNGDNTNDILYITVAGLKQFDYFRIYNRWGNMVYSTTNPSLGWDGTFGGYKQPPGTYVFAAHGTDYLDKPVFRKGTLVLIR